MTNHTSSPFKTRLALWIIGGVFVIAAFAALRAASPVAIPVVFAVLIALIVAPLHRKMVQALPTGFQWLAHLGVMLCLLALIFLLLGALVFAAERVLQELPDLNGNIQSLLPSGQDASTFFGGRLKDLWGTISGALGGWLVDQISTLARGIAGLTGVFISTLVLVFFLVLLALTERETWRGKLNTLGGNPGWTRVLHTIAHRLRQFLLIRTAIGVLQAALYVVWLWLFGVDLLIVWAVLTFILTYIPNLGSVISGTLPVLYALATKDWTTALGVAAGILAIEQIIGNFVDPKILGKYIVLSPFVILVNLLFWAWVWGAAGAFLATPILLVALIVLNNLPALRPIALMLSDQRAPDDLDAALAKA